MTEERSGGRGIALGFLCAVMILVAFLSARELLAIYHASKRGPEMGPGLERAAEISPGNWSHLMRLADLEKARGQSSRALTHYRAAIDVFEGCARCWAGVAEAETALGRDPSEALEKAIRYGRSSTSVRTRTAVVYARLGRHEEAAREFSAALGGKQEDTAEFYGLLHRLYPADVVLDRIVEATDLRTYFQFARRRLTSAEAARVWERFERQDESERQRDHYVGYLLARGLAHDAWRVAFPDKPPARGVVINGDFEDAAGHGRFGWALKDGDGVRARVVGCNDCESGRRALRLEFDGEHNAHYHGVAQPLPVVPGASYVLKARVKYDAITSARGPSLMVQGVSGKAGDPTEGCSFITTGEEFRLSSPWRETTLGFSVPINCEGIRVLVARPRTKKLNKFIGGELWIDEVSLERAATGPSCSG